jgi:hypothetical protein
MNNNKKTILVLTANPTDTGRLRLDKEVREIEEGLKRSNKRSKFKIVAKFAVRTRDILQAVLENKPQIIHFSGHGETKGLLVEDESGKHTYLNINGLAQLFAAVTTQNPIECVLLNACYSREQAEAISKHIKYVTGMENSVGDNEAISFAVAFYDTLGAGAGYEYAFKIAKVFPAVNNLPNINPAIYIDGILQNEQPESKTPPIIEPTILSFKNRTAEIEKIFSATTKNFIVLDAPAGYGKTELLKKIVEKYDAENENSGTEFIDLKQQKSIQQALSYLYGKNGFGDYHSNKLAHLLAEKNNLIIFDNAEHISDIESLFIFLKETQDYDFSNIKIIISGRYIASGINATRWKKNNFDIIPLSPLNQNVIREIINERSPRTLRNDAKQKLAKKIYFLSGGHPQIIAILIALLEKDGWIFLNTDKDIFHTYIHPHLNIIFEKSFIGVDLVCNCFKKLSIFRQFNLSTIQFLKDSINLSLEHHAKDAMNLVAKLGLVTKRGDIGFYSDSIMRHLLRVCENLYNEEDFFKINELAVPFYKDTMEKNPITTEFCSKEIVYHALQQRKFDLPIVREELKKLLIPCINSWGYSWENLDKDYFENFMAEDNKETIELLKDKNIDSFCELLGL